MAKLKQHILRIITDEFVYLEDGGKGLSITEDVENVVHLLQLNWQLGSRKIFYKDEYGHIDEIVLKDSRFSHFKAAKDSPFIIKINSILSPKR